MKAIHSSNTVRTLNLYGWTTTVSQMKYVWHSVQGDSQESAYTCIAYNNLDHIHRDTDMLF